MYKHSHDHFKLFFGPGDPREVIVIIKQHVNLNLNLFNY